MELKLWFEQEKTTGTNHGAHLPGNLIISERTKNFSRSFDCRKFVARDTFYPNLASGYHCYRDLVTVHQKLFSQALT